MIRITGGSLKGKKLLVPKVANLRPTTDRVRESVFNILGSLVEEARVLDLFAGTGALGIEALSRGALEAIFVEKDRKTIEALRKNISSCELQNKSTIFPMSAEKAIPLLKKRSGKFNLIFLDPPYHSSLTSKVLPSLSPLLFSEGMIVVEYDIYEKPLIDESVWVVEDIRRFGTTAVCFLSALK
ncbi:MAG: 16S rRNA (guanine(966)-N(2))-methyltransferase RsmD [Syntrophobacterales bacterium]|nr:16S rRNA (guanine(966)-N(2))-methyltransferase RsmD [Syntrophobacterales bacterium]